MAFGGLKGTLTGNANSITNPAVMSGSVAVVVGDLVYGVVGQQTNLTATTTITDNLGNTYAYQNAGTDGGVPTGRPFWGRITVAGTLTTINCPATASTNDWAGLAAVIEGPFISSPLDGNPANITSDATSPFTCPLSGTLAQAHEVVVGWGAANQSTVWAATSPNLLAGNANNSTNIKVAIGYQKVIVTTSISPVFTAAADPSACVLGTASFKGDLSADLSKTLGTLTASSNTTVDIGATSAKTLGTLTASANASVDDNATLAKTLGDVAISATATVEDANTNATLAQTLVAVTSSSNATVDTTATAEKTLAAVTSSANATVDETASLSVTLGAATSSATATVADDATLARTLGDVASAATSSVDIAATLAQTLGDVLLSGAASGEEVTEATLAQTLAALTATGAASVDIQATLAKALAAVTLAASGSVDIDASLARTLGALSSASAADPGDCFVISTLDACILSAQVEQRRTSGTAARAGNIADGAVRANTAGAFGGGQRDSATGVTGTRANRQGGAASRGNRRTGATRN